MSNFTNSVCNKCHLFYYKELDDSVKDQLSALKELKCPLCGEQTKVIVSTKMNIIVRKLVEKGYNILNVYNKEMGLEIDPIPSDEILEFLPSHYRIMKDPKSNTIIFYDGRILDGQNLSDDELSLNTIALMKFAREVLSVGIGRSMNKEDIESLEKEREEAERHVNLYIGDE